MNYLRIWYGNGDKCSINYTNYAYPFFAWQCKVLLNTWTDLGTDTFEIPCLFTRARRNTLIYFYQFDKISVLPGYELEMLHVNSDAIVLNFFPCYYVWTDTQRCIEGCGHL